MNDFHETELSIDTPQGLQEFLRFIEDVYQDFIIALQQTQGAEVLVGGELLAVEMAHTKAKELVAHYTKVLEFGGELQESDTTALQELYDTIAAAYGTLTHSQSPVQLQEAQPISTNLHGLDATADRAKLLAVRADELVYEFSELETAKITTPELKLGKLLYEQLKGVAQAALRQVAEIERVAMTPMASADLLTVAKRIDDELDTLTATLEQLQKSLLRFFETDTFVEQTPERKRYEESTSKQERAAKLFDQPSIFTDVVKFILTEPDNRSLLQQQFSSPAAFEAYLKREMYRVEAPSKLDALLGIKYESPFVFLKDMTLREIDSFDTEQSREVIRARLQEKNIPYETYMTWMQAIPYMESLVAAYDDMTFIELYVRSEIALLRSELSLRSNAQGVYNS